MDQSLHARLVGGEIGGEGRRLLERWILGTCGWRMCWDQGPGWATAVCQVARGNKEVADGLDEYMDMDGRWCGLRCPGQWAS